MDDAAVEDEVRPDDSIPSPVLLTGMARQAWQLYRANLGALFLTFLPFIAFASAVFYFVVISITLRPANYLMLVLSRDLLHIVVASFGVAAAAILVTDRLAGLPGRVRDSLAEATRAAPRILLVAIVAALFYCLTFFILGPFLRELFVGPPIIVTVLVLERKSLGDALGRARELFAPNWTRSLLYMITFAAGIGLLDFVIQQIALRGVTAASTSIIGYVLAVGVSVVVPSIVVPYIACAWLIAYFDARARVEDFDEPALIALRTTPPPPN